MSPPLPRLPRHRRPAGGAAAAAALLGVAWPSFADSSATYSFSAAGQDATDLQDAFEVLPGDNQTGWLGADSDVSVVIGGGPGGGPRRVLWLFADTFLARHDAKTRARIWDGMHMPSSTVALAACAADKCSGRPTFFWREDAKGAPAPFFELPEAQRENGELLWVVAGIASRDGSSVLLLAQRVQRPLTVLGSTAIVIHNVDQVDDPRQWQYTMSELGDEEMTWFSGVTFAEETGDQVLLFGHEHTGGPHSFGSRGRKDPEHWSRTLLARASLSDLLRHDWSAAKYWAEPGRWAPVSRVHGRRRAQRLDVPTWETTCTWSSELGLWYVFNVEGHVVAMWTAQQVVGPWSRNEVYRLPPAFRKTTSDNGAWLCYAAKAHPEMQRKAWEDRAFHGPAEEAGLAELVFSWVCNAWGGDAERALLFQPGGLDLSVRGYWPRFVRVAAAVHRPLTIHVG
mmetsp:Transcript_20685/g.52821  ORF Transcript_20685/g.52821 Transcript_20685/m.52821 type:complete len:454 (+) Transcript_20685:71-1432(+)